MNAAPQWGHSGGKRCIKVLTLCHGGTHHNAAFDPETHKITCFSKCGNKTRVLHNWVSAALGTDNPNEGKQFIEKWMDEAEIDLSDVIPGASGGTTTYHAFDPDMRVEMVKGIDPKILAGLYSQFDTTPQTLSRLKWHLPKAQGGDEIPLQQLIDFDVAYTGVPMSWETWAAPLLDYHLRRHRQCGRRKSRQSYWRGSHIAGRDQDRH